MAMIRKAASDIIETDVDDETIIVSLESGEMFSLSGTARAIWEKLEAGMDESDLVDALTDEFEVEEEVLRADLAKFLADSREAGLIES
ncbi:PqqD family protein [Erythrobacter sp. HKB08]|uniref:PqqD family protein n=1 Tax=Erythrobacter sp. HKB08 TaxID=2502843 RepID=UPI001009265A|nr:PqqD family protein [Erythrobacter sp. HKB08]